MPILQVPLSLSNMNALQPPMVLEQIPAHMMRLAAFCNNKYDQYAEGQVDEFERICYKIYKNYWSGCNFNTVQFLTCSE